MKNDIHIDYLQYNVKSTVFSQHRDALTFISCVLKHGEVLASGKAAVYPFPMEFTVGYFFQQYF